MCRRRCPRRIIACDGQKGRAQRGAPRRGLTGDAAGGKAQREADYQAPVFSGSRHSIPSCYLRSPGIGFRACLLLWLLVSEAQVVPEIPSFEFAVFPSSTHERSHPRPGLFFIVIPIRRSAARVDHRWTRQTRPRRTGDEMVQHYSSRLRCPVEPEGSGPAIHQGAPERVRLQQLLLATHILLVKFRVPAARVPHGSQQGHARVEGCSAQGLDDPEAETRRARHAVVGDAVGEDDTGPGW